MRDVHLAHPCQVNSFLELMSSSSQHLSYVKRLYLTLHEDQPRQLIYVLSNLRRFRGLVKLSFDLDSSASHMDVYHDSIRDAVGAFPSPLILAFNGIPKVPSQVLQGARCIEMFRSLFSQSASPPSINGTVSSVFLSGVTTQAGFFSHGIQFQSLIYFKISGLDIGSVHSFKSFLQGAPSLRAITVIYSCMFLFYFPLQLLLSLR